MKNALQTIVEKNPMQLLLQAVSVLVLLLNLWLASKLAPLAEGIHSNEYRIGAIESDYARKTSMETGFNHIQDSLDKIEIKIDRLEDKIDRL